MKKLGMIMYDAFNFDDAVQVVTEQFNEIKRSNPTVEYKDIDVTFGFFHRTWVVLVFEYDDQEFPAPEIKYDDIESNAIQYIGMMPGLDPSDPNWRIKQETWRRTLSS